MPEPTPIAGTTLTGSGVFPTVQTYGAYIYWGLGIVASLAAGYLLYKLNFQIAGVLTFLGCILALFYYYVKWFQIPSQTSSWPPYTTPCPDFLTLVDPGTTSGIAKCMDYVGVSSNGQLNKADPKNAAHRTNATYNFSIDKNNKTQDLCEAAAGYGLTWSSICPE